MVIKISFLNILKYYHILFLINQKKFQQMESIKMLKIEFLFINFNILIWFHFL